MPVIDKNTTFRGYRRENGRVGVRNHVIILPLDDLSNAAAEAVAAAIKGTMAIPHPYGRLQFGPDLDLHFQHPDRHRLEPERRRSGGDRHRGRLDQESGRRHRADRQAGGRLRHRGLRRPRDDQAGVDGRQGSSSSTPPRCTGSSARSATCGCRPSAASRTRPRAAAPIRPSATRSTSCIRSAPRWCSARPPRSPAARTSSPRAAPTTRCASASCSCSTVTRTCSTAGAPPTCPSRSRPRATSPAA